MVDYFLFKFDESDGSYVPDDKKEPLYTHQLEPCSSIAWASDREVR